MHRVEDAHQASRTRFCTCGTANGRTSTRWSARVARRLMAENWVLHVHVRLLASTAFVFASPSFSIVPHVLHRHSVRRIHVHRTPRHVQFVFEHVRSFPLRTLRRPRLDPHVRAHEGKQAAHVAGDEVDDQKVWRRGHSRVERGETRTIRTWWCSALPHVSTSCEPLGVAMLRVGVARGRRRAMSVVCSRNARLVHGVHGGRFDEHQVARRQREP